MTSGPWRDLVLEVLGESDATPEFDHLLHHVEDRFDARMFEGEIRAALDALEAEGRITYSGVQGYEVIEEAPTRADGGDRDHID